MYIVTDLLIKVIASFFLYNVLNLFNYLTDEMHSLMTKYGDEQEEDSSLEMVENTKTGTLSIFSLIILQ